MDRGVVRSHDQRDGAGYVRYRSHLVHHCPRIGFLSDSRIGGVVNQRRRIGRSGGIVNGMILRLQKCWKRVLSSFRHANPRFRSFLPSFLSFIFCSTRNNIISISSMNPTRWGAEEGNAGGGGFFPATFNVTAPEHHAATATTPTSSHVSDDADLPLLEELGIVPSHIRAKSLAVLHPFRVASQEEAEEGDLAGPLVFALLLGLLLTLQGKIHFGAIYVLSIVGVSVTYMMLSLMSDAMVSVQLIMSSLGYCLLPNLFLALCRALIGWVLGAGQASSVTAVMGVASILWSAWCATNLFVVAFGLARQKYLIMYPLTIFYAVFTAITIF